MKQSSERTPESRKKQDQMAYEEYQEFYEFICCADPDFEYDYVNHYEKLLFDEEFKHDIEPILRTRLTFYAYFCDAGGETVAASGVTSIGMAWDVKPARVNIWRFSDDDDTEAVQMGAPHRIYEIRAEEEEMIRIFKGVLCRGQVPDLSQWHDVTKNIYQKTPTHKGTGGVRGKWRK